MRFCRLVVVHESCSCSSAFFWSRQTTRQSVSTSNYLFASDVDLVSEYLQHSLMVILYIWKLWSSLHLWRIYVVWIIWHCSKLTRLRYQRAINLQFITFGCSLLFKILKQTENVGHRSTQLRQTSNLIGRLLSISNRESKQWRVVAVRQDYRIYGKHQAGRRFKDMFRNVGIAASRTCFWWGREGNGFSLLQKSVHNEIHFVK